MNAEQEAREFVDRLWRERIGYVEAVTLLTGLLQRRNDEAHREIKRLQGALADAPDMTCESLEARAWREKYAHLLATPPAPEDAK